MAESLDRRDGGRRTAPPLINGAGNPAGRLRGSRNKLSEEVICALLRDFRKHGEKAVAKVRRDQPGVYLKVLALLIPRQDRLEQWRIARVLAASLRRPRWRVRNRTATHCSWQRWVLTPCRICSRPSCPTIRIPPSRRSYTWSTCPQSC